MVQGHREENLLLTRSIKIVLQTGPEKGSRRVVVVPSVPSCVSAPECFWNRKLGTVAGGGGVRHKGPWAGARGFTYCPGRGHYALSGPQFSEKTSYSGVCKIGRQTGDAKSTPLEGDRRLPQTTGRCGEYKCHRNGRSGPLGHPGSRWSCPGDFNAVHHETRFQMFPFSKPCSKGL